MRKDLRPPLPCATSWLHSDLVTHPSRAFYYATQAGAVESAKLVALYFILTLFQLSDSYQLFFKVFLDPFLMNFLKNIRVLSFKNLKFRPQKKAFRPIFCQKRVFKGLNIKFLRSYTLFFLNRQRMGVKNTWFKFGKDLMALSVFKLRTNLHILPTSPENWWESLCYAS